MNLTEETLKEMASHYELVARLYIHAETNLQIAIGDLCSHNRNKRAELSREIAKQALKAINDIKDFEINYNMGNTFPIRDELEKNIQRVLETSKNIFS